MPDLATRRPPTAPARREPNALPPATTAMTIEDALEMSGVSRPEFALIAASSGKEARSLEELVTFISFARKRGLDPALRQVYLVPFDGTTPSLHTGIDGLRAIAARTGRYAGSTDAVYRGSYQMVVDGQKVDVPEQATVVVWAIVQGQKCAFEGTAFMAESYPGPGGRGNMWRKWPRRMLAKAAEALALRKGFPADLQGIEADDALEADTSDTPPPSTQPRTSITSGMSDADKARLYDEFFGQTGELPAPAPPPKLDPDARQAQLLAEYHKLLRDALAKGAVADAHEWALSSEQAPEVEIIEHGRRLRAAVNAHLVAQAQRPTTAAQSEPGEVASPPAPRRAEMWAERRELEVKALELGIRVPTLNTRCADEELAEANDALRASITAVEDDLAAEAPDDAQQALV